MTGSDDETKKWNADDTQPICPRVDAYVTASRQRQAAEREVSDWRTHFAHLRDQLEGLEQRLCERTQLCDRLRERLTDDEALLAATILGVTAVRTVYSREGTAWPSN